MSEKKNIEDTRMLMENWQSHIEEQGGGLAGMNRAKVAQLLKQLVGKGTQEVGDEDIVGSEDLPGGEGTDDAMPADGTDDDSLEGTDDDFDVDVASQKDQLQMAHATNFLNHYLNYDKFRVNIVKMVRDNLRRALDRATKSIQEQGDIDEQGREAIYREVANVILNRVEMAVKKALPPSARDLVISDLKESLNSQLFPVLVEVCRREDKKMLSESKKITIKMGR